MQKLDVGYKLRWMIDALVLMVVFVGSCLTTMINGLARDKKQ